MKVSDKWSVSKIPAYYQTIWSISIPVEYVTNYALRLPLISRKLESHKPMEGWVSPPLVRAPDVSKNSFQMNSMNRQCSNWIATWSMEINNSLLSSTFTPNRASKYFSQILSGSRSVLFLRSRWKSDIIGSLFEISRAPVLMLTLATHGIVKLDKIFKRRRLTVSGFLPSSV